MALQANDDYNCFTPASKHAIKRGRNDHVIINAPTAECIVSCIRLGNFDEKIWTAVDDVLARPIPLRFCFLGLNLEWKLSGQFCCQYNSV